ncbi:hypothetical protein [Cerasicoccus arenae]|uniref:Uncharacterized protein n=1 Tax=Cerasicoccus arenae TaxID=424488 RepID=A0A8J3GDP9_9BACT|nr:hypothetical protein [Cerasicoccus arenae]MBK1859368.1 hypothetical protein [Cerasicoccus arenae]GHB93299.1 hypothetical protein GCM10007047_05810 [Cerasicoccus arenae]
MNDRRHLLDRDIERERLRRAESRESRSPATGCYEEVGADSRTVIRLVLNLKNGLQVSYPYANMSLVELISAGRLAIHGTCPIVERIEIEGKNLEPLARLLALQRLSSVSVRSRTAFSTDYTQITCIRIIKD